MHEIAVYQRELPVSLERMFENALDWEHLPHVHRGSFAELDLVDHGPTHWTAKVVLQPAILGLRQTVRLTLEREVGVWITEVLAGVSRGLQIHTQATARAERAIAVHVRFLAPRASLRYRALGPIYVATYRRLYDEDERMMVARQLELDRARGPAGFDGPRRLGTRAEVLRDGYRLELGGHGFRVVELDGELVAFSTLCPHMLGPLEDAAVIDGQVRCPWHGYCFDVRTGEGRGQRLRLKPAPQLEQRDGAVWALPAPHRRDT